MIKNNKFYCRNKEVYPPFKNGLYLEEYFLKKWSEDNHKTKRKYIPVLWTNFQIESWFNNKRHQMQNSLNDWVEKNPSNDGYFIVVQHDLGALLRLPENTITYGACSGTIPIPLIYQDINNILENIPKKSFSQKNILCSFIGSITCNGVKPVVRPHMNKVLSNNKNFKLINSGGWTTNVKKKNQMLFINETINSKFGLAPRGFGRSSFRFFEILLLGSIPVYIWNDIEWLPFKDIIDYKKLCISIHISKINTLEEILLSITEEKYNEILCYYNEIKHLFKLEGMYNKIIAEND